jgi:hypothetical protein
MILKKTMLIIYFKFILKNKKYINKRAKFAKNNYKNAN